MTQLISLLFALSFLLAPPLALAQSQVSETVLIVRHAEADDSTGLSDEGAQRAEAYARYFKDFTLDGQKASIGYLFSAVDSDNSMRPRLTLEPTAQALGLTIDADFRTKDVDKLAATVRGLPKGAVALVAWRHSRIPALLQSFGADPAAVLPDGRWPGKVYDWVIVLQFDADGKLVRSQRVSFKLS